MPPTCGAFVLVDAFWAGTVRICRISPDVGAIRAGRPTTGNLGTISVLKECGVALPRPARVGCAHNALLVANAQRCRGMVSAPPATPHRYR